MKYALILLALTQSLAFAKAKLTDRIQEKTWEGLDVVWLEDERFPTYTISFYFADGALGDHPSRRGETEMMFSLLKSGTNRFNQVEISDNLEFYGVGTSSKVTHEYSTYTISGLVKDLVPTMKQICHLFKDTVFPKQEVSKYKKIATNNLTNLSSNHDALADHIFRRLSLKGTPVEYPTGGTIRSLNRIKSSDLARKLKYMNENVYKKVYITGPTKVLEVKPIIINECGWDVKNSTYQSSIAKEFNKPGKQIYLIPVNGANQAQVRMGMGLANNEIYNSDLMSLAANYLGGGFTSVLMQELRKKRGLTYGAYAFAVRQKDYGRAVIISSTQNKSVSEMMDVINSILKANSKEVDKDSLEKARGLLMGSYLFQFEISSAYLNNLLYFDLIGRDYNELLEFPKRVQDYTDVQVTKRLSELFDWDNQVIVVVGDSSLKKQLEKLGKVKVVKHKDFL